MSRPRIRLSLRSRIIAAATLAAVALGTVSGTAMLGPDPASPGRDSAVETAASGGDTTTSTTAGAFTEAPTDEVDDLTIAGPGGKVSGSDISLDLTSAGGAVAPVDLDPVEPFEPKPEAPKEPATINVLAGPGGAPAQDLVSNAKGCAAGCIESALLHRQIRKTDVRFTIETDRRAKFVAEISTQPPVYDGGIPSLPGAVKKVLPVRRMQWEATFEGLAPDTKHYFLVRATDGGGNTQHATTSFRTVKPIEAADDLAATPAGCAYQCISAGQASSITHKSANLRIETSTPAQLTVSVSTQEPGWIGGSPVLPSEVFVPVPTGLAKSWDIPVNALKPETTYHVVVRATDDKGRHSSRIGRFTTAAPPPVQVEATIRQVTIIDDGDPGVWGDGEISFAWGAEGGEGGGMRDQADLGPGDSFTLHSHNRMEFTVDADGFLPRIFVSGTEFDKPQLNCVNRGAISAPLEFTPGYSAQCRRRTNVASTGLLTPNIDAYPSCLTYGAIGDWENDRCVLIASEDLGENYPHFWVLISLSR